MRRLARPRGSALRPVAQTPGRADGARSPFTPTGPTGRSYTADPPRSAQDPHDAATAYDAFDAAPAR